MAADDAAKTYEALLKHAGRDPAVLGFWLGGSRGMGRSTEHSDYDCAVILADDATANRRAEIEAYRGPGLDLMLMTLGEFERYAEWGSTDAWFRYGCSHLTALVDKTGRVQPLIDAKGRVPPEAAAGFIEASLDHLINQLYRGLKCLRDGDPLASRLEAAQAVTPFLDAAFALHGGRLRPYYKYLAWELATYPLRQLPFGEGELAERLIAVLCDDGALALQALVRAALPAFRAAGFSSSIDGWGAAMDWILAWRPD